MTETVEDLKGDTHTMRCEYQRKGKSVTDSRRF